MPTRNPLPPRHPPLAPQPSHRIPHIVYMVRPCGVPALLARAGGLGGVFGVGGESVVYARDGGDAVTTRVEEGGEGGEEGEGGGEGVAEGAAVDVAVRVG